MLDDETAIIQRNYEEIWVNGNLDLLDLSLDPEIVRHNPPLPDIYGLPAYKEYVTGVRSAMSNIGIKIEDVMLTEDLSSARVTMTFTHTGLIPGLQIPATGRQVRLGMGVFSRWKGNQLVEEWVYMDHLGMLQQLGVFPMATRPTIE